MTIRGYAVAVCVVAAVTCALLGVAAFVRALIGDEDGASPW